MKNNFPHKLVPLKIDFASAFLLLKLFFSVTNCFFFANYANADVIYSRGISGESKNFNDKIDRIFNNLKNFNEYLEPKNEFSNFSAQKVALHDFRGQNIILYFWASWCKLCIQELGMLQKLNDELKFQSIDSVKIIPISIDYKSNGEVKSNLLNVISNLEVYRDDFKELMDALKVKSLPTTFFINKSGYIIYKVDEAVQWDNEYLLLRLKEMFKIDKPLEKFLQNKVLAEEQFEQKSNDSNVKEAIITPQNTKKTIFIN